MQAGAVGKPRVDERLCVVEPPPARRREALRQPPHRDVVAERQAHAAETVAPVDPYLMGAIDQHVRDRRIGEQRFQRSGARQLRAGAVR